MRNFVLCDEFPYGFIQYDIIIASAYVTLHGSVITNEIRAAARSRRRSDNGDSFVDESQEKEVMNFNVILARYGEI